MGSWRSGGGLFDANVACGGRRLHLGQRSGSIVSHFVRCVLLRVRPCLAYYEIDQGDTSGRRTHRRFGSFGVSRLSLGAVRELICWRACFSRMANIYRGTRQGWAWSVCVFHADFRRATLHVRGLHRHTDSGLDAGTSVLNVPYWSCVYGRRDGYRDQDTSASGGRAVGSHVSFVDNSSAYPAGICSHTQQGRIDQFVCRIGDEWGLLHCGWSGIKFKNASTPDYWVRKDQFSELAIASASPEEGCSKTRNPELAAQIQYRLWLILR